MVKTREKTEQTIKQQNTNKSLYFKAEATLTLAGFHAYLSNTLTNLCIALNCILLYCVVLNCIVLLIYCYVDIIQYNAMHKFVGVLDNPHIFKLVIQLLFNNVLELI